MKALVTADWHLSNALPYAKRAQNNLVTDRLKDLVEVLGWILKAAIDRDMPLIILGDIFDKRKLDAITLKEATRLFASASKAGLQVYILPGNHDAYDSRGLHYGVEAFSLAEIKGVRVMESGVMENMGEGVALCPVPYQSPGSTLELIEEYRKADYPTKILFLHDSIVGSIMSGNYPAETGISKKHLKGFSYVLAGHFHEFQKLDPIKGVYIGSPFQLSFGEIHNEPSIGLISTEARKVSFHRIKIPFNLSCCFGEIVMDSEGKVKKYGVGDEDEAKDPKYFRVIFEGSNEEYDLRKEKIDYLIKSLKELKVREVVFIHRKRGETSIENRLNINIMEKGIPPIESLIKQYAETKRETDSADYIKVAQSILGELE